MNSKPSGSMLGFSLIEAMLALTIIGLVLGPLFLLEDTVFTQVERGVYAFERFIAAQHFLYQARRAQPIAAREFAMEGKTERPSLQLQYRMKPFDQNSVFSKYPLLSQEKVSVIDPGVKGKPYILPSMYYKPKGIV